MVTAQICFLSISIVSSSHSHQDEPTHIVLLPQSMGTLLVFTVPLLLPQHNNLCSASTWVSASQAHSLKPCSQSFHASDFQKKRLRYKNLRACLHSGGTICARLESGQMCVHLRVALRQPEAVSGGRGCCLLCSVLHQPGNTASGPCRHPGELAWLRAPSLQQAHPFPTCPLARKS